MQEEIYLIDGSAYIYRAFHAIAPLSNSNGLPTHAVLGFVNMVKRLIREKSPKYLAVAFDSKGPVFRHEMYKEYKANRPPMPEDLKVQIPYIKKYVSAANLTVLEKDGVEADDLIASAVKKFTAQGHPVILVSGDKDLLQLVDDLVVMWDPMKDKVMDRDAVVQKYGVSPDHLLDLFALIGDSSDNVPGVPGVGPKTAEKLISSYDDLDGVYANLGAMKASKMKDKIAENKAQAFLSKDLIRLKDDVEVTGNLDDYLLREADDQSLVELYRELEFTSLLKGIDTASPVPAEGFAAVRTEEELARVLKVLSGADVVAFDTETTSINARVARLVGISLCCTLDQAWYIPVGHVDANGELLPDQLDTRYVLDALQPLLTAQGTTIVGHNLKYDVTVLLQHAHFPCDLKLADTLIAAHLTESGGRSMKLDDLCLERGIKLTSFTEVVGNDKRDDCFAFVDIDRATAYSCEDVHGTLLLWQEFKPVLEERGLMDLFQRVEMPIVSILAEMEIAGICVDPQKLSMLSDEFSGQLAALEKKIHAAAGHEFNINSPKQLGEVLFEEMGLPHGRKTKTGYSTDVKVLEKLAPKHEMPALVLHYRTIGKLLSTYVDKLQLLRDPDTNRVHTNFNQAVTATGRLSSSDPNLQNIPIRTEEGAKIREAFVPVEGKVFLSADYSQIDLRVLAHYSQDKALLAAFRGGEDIHARTAGEIFGLSPLMINSEMRRVAKSINFGIVYGMSSFGLSTQLDIPRKEAQRFIDKYFAVYSGVKTFMNDIVEQAREHGYVTTLLGRRRSVPDINAKNRNQREFAERMAINTPIQGTAADIIKLAMIGCHQVLEQEKLDVKMLLQIHDELVFELAEADVESAQTIIRQQMENALKIDVPLVVNFEVGMSLAK